MFMALHQKPVNRAGAKLGHIYTSVLFCPQANCFLFRVMFSSTIHSCLAGHCTSRPILQDNCLPALLVVQKRQKKFKNIVISDHSYADKAPLAATPAAGCFCWLREVVQEPCYEKVSSVSIYHIHTALLAWLWLPGQRTINRALLRHLKLLAAPLILPLLPGKCLNPTTVASQATEVGCIILRYSPWGEELMDSSCLELVLEFIYSISPSPPTQSSMKIIERGQKSVN